MEARGLRVVARNWRRVGCEIDVAATRGDFLYIVEVKARRHPVRDDATARALLPPPKLAALRRGARLFQAIAAPGARGVRIDLAVVIRAGAGVPALQYFVDVGRE